MFRAPVVALSAALSAVLVRAQDDVPEVVLLLEEKAVVVTIDGDLFTRVHLEGQPQPVCWPVRAAGGTHVTRDHPLTVDEELLEGEAKDHPHHRSVWFAHGDVNGVDFWHAIPGKGRIEVDEIVQGGGPDALAFTTRWLDTAQEPPALVCTGRRIYSFGGDRDGRRWIDLDITITASETALTFGDTKEGTMGVRVHPALRLRGAVAKGSILNSAGVRDGEAWGKRAAWVDYRGRIGDEVLGVALFDHPDNPRHPTWWHARDYGLLAANPFGRSAFEKAEPGAGTCELPRGESLRFRYRLLVHPDAPSHAALEELWGAWARRR